MSFLRSIIDSIKLMAQPKPRYVSKTFGVARMWDKHGNEIPSDDPRFIEMDRMMKASLEASMQPIDKDDTR